MAELKKNTDNKISFCKKKVQKAHEALARYPKDIADSAALLEQLTKIENVLIDNPDNGNLDELFDLANAIIKKGKDAEAAIESARLSELNEKRSRSEAALSRKFNAASTQLLRYGTKMSAGPALAEKLSKVSVAMKNLSAEKSLQWIFEVCDEVFLSINIHLNEQIESAVRRSHHGWLFAKGGSPGKYAEPYQATAVSLQVVSWLANKPLAGADKEAFIEWRRAGWAMVDDGLEYPFGKCECGKEPLLPYQKKGQTEWRPGKLGRLCYQAGAKAARTFFEGVEKVEPIERTSPNVVMNSVPMNTSDMSPEEFETHIAKVKAERLARKLALKEKNKEHTRKRETGGKDAPVQPRAVLTEDEKRLNDLLAKKALADHEREVRALAEKQNSTVHNKDSRKSKGKGGKQK